MTDCQLGCYFLVFSLMRMREFTNAHKHTHINTLSTVLSKWTKLFFSRFMPLLIDTTLLFVQFHQAIGSVCWDGDMGRGVNFTRLYARFSFNSRGRHTKCWPTHLVNQLLPLEKETAQAFTSCELRTINSSLHILFLHFFTIPFRTNYLCGCCCGHFEIYFALSFFVPRFKKRHIKVGNAPKINDGILFHQAIPIITKREIQLSVLHSLLYTVKKLLKFWGFLFPSSSSSPYHFSLRSMFEERISFSLGPTVVNTPKMHSINSKWTVCCRFPIWIIHSND